MPSDADSSELSRHWRENLYPEKFEQMLYLLGAAYGLFVLTLVVVSLV